MKPNCNNNVASIPEEPRCWGIDVGSKKFDVACHGDPTVLSFDNDPDGIARLVQHLQAWPCRRVVLEATGGYEIPLTIALGEATLPVVVANPRCVRAFATALGQLAKTDPIDARVIAHFGYAIQPAFRPLPTEKERLFTSVATRRRQLITLQTAEKNRRRQTAEKDILDSVNAVLEILDEQIKKLDERLAELIADNPQWAEVDEILQSTKGVGPITSRTLIAELPELGKIDDRKLAKLAGLAPLNQDSGKFKGVRIVQGGRASVRCALYMATLTAHRSNPQIAQFYKRLRARGKSFKVAMTACMHKLLTILNAMVRNKTTWKNPAPNILANT